MNILKESAVISTLENRMARFESSSLAKTLNDKISNKTSEKNANHPALSLIDTYHKAIRKNFSFDFSQKDPMILI
jgi:hypothetical protein